MTFTVRELRAQGVSERGLRLRQYRTVHGTERPGRTPRSAPRVKRMTLARVAELIGVHVSTVARLELGDRVSTRSAELIDAFLAREDRRVLEEATAAIRAGTFADERTHQELST